MKYLSMMKFPTDTKILTHRPNQKIWCENSSEGNREINILNRIYFLSKVFSMRNNINYSVVCNHLIYLADMRFGKKYASFINFTKMLSDSGIDRKKRMHEEVARRYRWKQ